MAPRRRQEVSIPADDPDLSDEASTDDGYGSDASDDLEPDAVEEIGSENLSKGKGLALNLPPITDARPAFRDMLSGCGSEVKSVSARGGFHMRVGTICSGTEAPIFALKLIQETVQYQNKAFSQNFITFEHKFSVEIEPFKQAYISRNAPGSIVFRDVADFAVPIGGQAPTSLGDLRPIPVNIDLLIAGTACVDFSTLNTKKASGFGAFGVGIDLTKKFQKYKKHEDVPQKLFDEFRQWLVTIDPTTLHLSKHRLGSSSLTFLSMMCYINSHRPKTIVIENVRNAPWDVMCNLYFRAVGYVAEYKFLDTKEFYIPQTRSRTYAVAVDAEFFGAQKAEIMVQMWASRLNNLKRAASSPVRDWLLNPNDALTVKARQDESERTITSGREGRAKQDSWQRSALRHARLRREIGIGDQRPLTAWGKPGIALPYDRIDKLLIKSLGTRPLDCLEIHYFRCILPGVDKVPGAHYDVRFKSELIDVSQNTDRGRVSTHFGIAGCLTPRGLNMIMDQGRLVSGFEALKLQGLPLRDLDLTRETQDQLRDLAGNAMSSTVVGASILSLLLALHENLPRNRKRLLPAARTESTDPGCEKAVMPLDQHLAQPGEDAEDTYDNLKAALDLAKRCRRYCYCNGGAKYSTDKLKQCTVCDTIRCANCAGNPEHSFQYAEPVDDIIMCDMIPSEMMKRFPTAMTDMMDESVNQPQLGPGLKAQALERRLVTALRTAIFTYTETLISEEVTVCYSGKNEGWNFRLQAVVSEATIKWYLFLDPWFGHGKQLCIDLGLKPKDFSRPVGRQVVQGHVKSYLPGRRAWEFWSFTPVSFGVMTTRSDNGSVKVVVKGIDRVQSELQEDLRSIEAVYEHHPECDAAEETLHVSTGGVRPSTGQKLYLFKDTLCLGSPKEDCFVISDSSRPLERHEHRDMMINFPPQWTPESPGAVVNASVTGYWQPAAESHKETARFASTLSAGSQYVPPIDILPTIDHSHRGRTLASVSMSVNTLEENYAMLWKYQSDPPAWTAVRRSDHAAVFGLLAPVNVRLHGVEGTVALESPSCVTCSPAKPAVHWVQIPVKMDKKTKVTKYVRRPYRFCADLERLRKDLEAAGEPLRVMLKMEASGDSSCRVTANYEMNLEIIQHRARGYLPPLGRNHEDVPIATWINIRKESLNIPNLRFEPFEASLKALGQDGPLPEFQIPFRNGLTLSKAQLHSLAWMLQKDREPPAFAERESEECTIDALNMNVTATAQRHVKIRGGVLADDVGFGKTVVCLALIGIQRDSDVQAVQTLRLTNMNNNKSALAATLIIAPSHLVKQWATEATKFLGWTGDHVVVIKKHEDLRIRLGTGPTFIPSADRRRRRKVDNAVGQLDRFKNARLIVVDKNIFDKRYYTELGKYAGSPTCPPGFDGKKSAPLYEFGAFQDWYRDAVGHLRHNVDGYDLTVFNPSRISTVVGRQKDVLRQWDLVRRDYENTTPERYEKPEQVGAVDAYTLRTPTFDRLGEGDFVDEKGFLLLEAFTYARVVFDEVSYANFASTLFMETADAPSKWVLSATPPTDNLAGLCGLAATLNVHVARPVHLRPGIPLIAEGPAALAEDRADAVLSYSTLYSDRNVIERVEQGHKFLQHFASANPFDEVGLGRIPVIEQVYCSRMTRVEFARYIDVQTEFQSQKAVSKDLAKRHELDLRGLHEDDQLFAGYALSYVASVECGGMWGGTGDLLERRRKRLAAAEAKLKHVMDIAFWLITRRAEEAELRPSNKKKPNPSVMLIIEDLVRFLRDVVGGVAVMFGGVEGLEAIARALFGPQGVPPQLKEDAPEQVIWTSLSPSETVGLWKYFRFDEDLVAKMPRDDKVEVLREIESVDEDISDADAEAILLQHVRERLEREKKEAEAAKEAKRVNKSRNALSSELKPLAKKDKNKKEEKKKTDKSGMYPVLFGTRANRGVTYSETEAELCDVILAVNLAMEGVAVAAKQLTAAQSVLGELSSAECQACGSKSAPLIFLPRCGHFLCKSHEDIEACGHIKSSRYPGGSGCSSFVPKRWIPIEQIQSCAAAAAKAEQKYSSKSRLILDTIKRILAETDDGIILFWQFGKQFDELCAILDEAKIKFIAGTKIEKVPRRKAFVRTRVRLLELKSEEAAGVNLQDHNHVMFVSAPVFARQSDFEKCVRQAKGRVIRYGQKKNVQVYYFVSANTFEVDLIQLRKRAFIRPRDGSATSANLICDFEDWPKEEEEDADEHTRATAAYGPRVDVDVNMEDAPSDDKP